MEGRRPPKAEFPTKQVILERLALLREAATALRSSANGRARLLIGQALAHEPGHVSPLGALAHLSKPGDCRTITSEMLVLIGGLARQLRRGSFGGDEPYDIGTAPDKLDYLIGKVEAIAAAKPKPKPLRRSRTRSPAPLTSKQTEAVTVVGQCEGDYAKAAAQIGRDPKTVRQHYKAAMKKLGKRAMDKPKTSSLKTDRRGQPDVCHDDDRRN